MRKSKTFIFLLLILLSLLINCVDKLPRSQLPQPILPDYPEIENLYWKAWEILSKHISKGTMENGFSELYINTSSDGVIKQWDTIFTALFSMYGYNVFPVMESIDNFYNKQRLDGFISSAYVEISGELAINPTSREPMINPPLFTWAELKYFQITGDSSRLKTFFPNLERYFLWIDANCRYKDRDSQLYYTTPLGSVMYNLPRENLEFGMWIDISSQMAMFARDLSKIAAILGDKLKQDYYSEKYQVISQSIHKELWDNETCFYYDRTRYGEMIKVKTIASFWPLLAEIPQELEVTELIKHLSNTAEFKRLHMFPSVAADEQYYNPSGSYWRGGVWSSANYMIIQGLLNYNQYEFASGASWNHIQNMAYVYSKFIPDSSRLDSRYDNIPLNTIWELYSPERREPGTRWDAKMHGKPESIANSGHGPISMLIENIIGLGINAPEDRLTWRPWLFEENGVENLRFGDNIVNIWCEKRDKLLPFTVHGKTTSPLTIDFVIGEEIFTVEFDKGPIEISIVPRDFILEGRVSN
jgi:hypothetical protein